MTRLDFWDEQLHAVLAYVAHDGRLSARVDDDSSARDHLAGRLKRLRVSKGEDHPEVIAAQRELDGPPIPPALHYLVRWSWELHGRSGVGMDGYAPLSFTTIRDWAVLTERVIEPHEVHALLVMDAVRRNPPKSPEIDHG